ncbi:MAG: SDR family NAD(P)-dependent oxidoreductase [Candidatus Nanopelagicales bacterium]
MAETVAVVTGAAGQIGRIITDRLSARGDTVVGLDLPSACPPGDSRFIGCDLTDDAVVQQVMRDILAEHERIDLLVLSAGLSAIGSFEDYDLATHRRVMDVTHFAAVSVALAAMPGLRRSRGQIVLIGSVAGFAPVLGRPAYVAAKHAVTGLFTAIGPELARDGVRVTIVHPTFVAGGMTEVDRAPGASRATSGASLTPEQVAQAALSGAAAGTPVVLVGRTARLAWTVNRLAPRLYLKLMTRRLRTRETP